MSFDTEHITKNAKKHGMKAVAGSLYTAIIVYCHTTFVTNPQLAKVEANLQATRDILMVLKGSLRLESKYE